MRPDSGSPTPTGGRALAVIDVGSNSGRIVVLRIRETGHLEVLADSRAPLRLARDVQRSGRISETAIARTAAAVKDFGAIAAGAGAEQIVAVATSAVRDSANAAELLDRVGAVAGMPVRVITGADEARHALRGAIHGLPVTDGLLMDIGGGSLELASFSRRRLVRSWTLPLGALRTSDEFLRSDPPTGPQIDGLRRRAAELLGSSEVPILAGSGLLVGTGGTVRNLAKIDRRVRAYPIPRLHGHVLERPRVEQIGVRLAARTGGRRRSVPGLNRDRADSIVGGAMVALIVMRHVGATQLLVSGQGLREGLALDAAGVPESSVEAGREASVAALAARFSEWDAQRADRRSALIRQLSAAAWPDAGDEMAERLRHAAVLLDVGRSIDYYRRHQHTADIVAEADLAGFTHRQLALLAAVIRSAGDESVRWRPYRPLLTAEDKGDLARASVLLSLADAAEQRLSPSAAAAARCRRRQGAVELELPISDPWLAESLARRYAAAFGDRLEILAPSAAEAG
ncbi:MAG TPA: Ppx/GppA phosphatase family protein [Egibacteraceae bacterium]|nr:Ppx/GppA phosphatase family protein [Egibacteraceae bacterium]